MHFPFSLPPPQFLPSLLFARPLHALRQHRGPQHLALWNTISLSSHIFTTRYSTLHSPFTLLHSFFAHFFSFSLHCPLSRPTEHYFFIQSHHFNQTPMHSPFPPPSIVSSPSFLFALSSSNTEGSNTSPYGTQFFLSSHFITTIPTSSPLFPPLS